MSENKECKPNETNSPSETKWQKSYSVKFQFVIDAYRFQVYASNTVLRNLKIQQVP